jgi:hypothetical protein
VVLPVAVSRPVIRLVAAVLRATRPAAAVLPAGIRLVVVLPVTRPAVVAVIRPVTAARRKVVLRKAVHPVTVRLKVAPAIQRHPRTMPVRPRPPRSRTR